MSGGQDLDAGSGFILSKLCPWCGWALKKDGTCWRKHQEIGGEMRICGQCGGKGKFEAKELKLNDKTISVPEMKCYTCGGQGFIAAPQMGEGYPPVIGGIREN